LGTGTNPHGFTFWNFSISRADTLFLQNWPVPDDLGPQPCEGLPECIPCAALQVCDEQTVSASGLGLATLGGGETMDLSPLNGNYVLAHAMSSPASEVFMTWSDGTQWNFPGWAYGCSPYGCYWHYDFETPVFITGSAGHTLTVTGLTLWNTSIWGGYGYIGYFLGSTNANVLSFAYLSAKGNPRWIAKPTVAYLWARTVTCKNCRATIPLLKTRWLCKTDRKARVCLWCGTAVGRHGREQASRAATDFLSEGT
jgi:hypothetical protein